MKRLHPFIQSRSNHPGAERGHRRSASRRQYRPGIELLEPRIALNADPVSPTAEAAHAAAASAAANAAAGKCVQAVVSLRQVGRG